MAAEGGKQILEKMKIEPIFWFNFYVIFYLFSVFHFNFLLFLGKSRKSIELRFLFFFLHSTEIQNKNKENQKRKNLLKGKTLKQTILILSFRDTGRNSIKKVFYFCSGIFVWFYCKYLIQIN